MSEEEKKAATERLAEAKEVEAVELTLREIRKVNEPRFNGTPEGFPTWKKMFVLTMKGYGMYQFFTSASMPAQTVNIGDVVQFKKKLDKYMSSMMVLRSYFVRLLPTSLASQVLGLNGTSRATTLEKCVISDEARTALDLPDLLDSEGHVHSMFIFICNQFEATTMAEKQALWNVLEKIRMRGSDFDGCYAEILNKANELRAVGQIVENDKLFAVLINAMPKRAMQVVTSIQCDNKTFDEAVKILRAYFKTMNVYEAEGKQEGRKKSEREEASVLMVNASARNIKCHGCGKIGHKVANCWKVHPDRAPKKSEDSKQEKEGSRKPQFNKGPRCFKCKKFGHKMAECRSQQGEK